MVIVQAQQLSLQLAGQALLESVNFTIEAKQKVCLIGRNGAGKSTLLRLLLGQQEPDAGSIEIRRGLTLGVMSQVVPHDLTGSVQQVVQTGLTLDDADTWRLQYQVEKVLAMLQLNPNDNFAHLSGGLKRRVLLAKALVAEPDILLLDEPTNHLDIPAIEWLEKFLIAFPKTVIFVTHDRQLMQRVATQILDIDNGQIISWRGSYYQYLKHKAQLLEAEQRANALFDKKLAQEEAWIRQGIKARRTRNEGRVRRLQSLRQEYAQRRTRVGNVKFEQQATQLSGKQVFELKNVSYHVQDNVIIKDFSTLIMRGDKIGLIGPNGSGKSTLLKLLLGELQPTQGNVERGTHLSIASFNQYLADLDEDKTVQDNVAPHQEMIQIGDKQKHVLSYLQDFLFTPERARTKVRVLSGGERSRVMLAKMMAQPCNLLILDEPTNDLDVETLELLESLLVEFSGTLIVVSHDREFLNNVVTSTLVMEGHGKIGEYAGGYDDWLMQSGHGDRQILVEGTGLQSTQSTLNVAATTPSAVPSNKTISSTKANKLSYEQSKELAAIPKKIAKWEQQVVEVQQQLQDADLYTRDNARYTDLTNELKRLEQVIEQAYERWEALEKLQSSS
ncbi:MAG: ATP-binding cassette domain-containing protein [Gammaproteobacteria bacterium]